MRKYTIHDIDKMDGHEFEYFCAELLKNTGYEKVKVTQGSGDQGIDVIAYKDGIKFGIQCKCYASDIGNKAVQEAFSGKEFYKCHIGVVFCNRYFTSSAMELATRNRILLWDRSYLIDLLKNSDLLYEDNTEEETSFGISTDESQSTETMINSNLNGDEKIGEIQSTEIIVNDDNNDNESVDESQLLDTSINSDSHEDERANSIEQNEKYDIFIIVHNKHIIKNSIMRDNRAREISRITGIPFTHARASLLTGSSRLMSNLSREEAERIVNSLKPMGCTIYMKENGGQDQEVDNSILSNIKAAVFIILLGFLPPILTKISWDFEHKIGDGFGILSAIFLLLSFLITGPMIILLIHVLTYDKQKNEGNNQ